MGPTEYGMLRADARRIASRLTKAVRESGDTESALKISQAETHAYALVRILTALVHDPQGTCCFGTSPCALHG